MEMRILDLVSGVEIWKATLSKSDTTWSMDTGGALVAQSASHVKADVGMGCNPEKRSMRRDWMSTF